MFVNHKSQDVLTKEKFLSLNISLGSYNSFVSSIINLAKNNSNSYVCVANVHMLVEAHKDSDFQNIVNHSTICTPDGMPLVWGLRFFTKFKQHRVSGMDLLPDILKEAEHHNISVYFYGGSDSMLKVSQVFINANYPKLKVAGMHSPPFRLLTSQEEDEDAARIRKSGAKLVLVVLGCPKQEKWMARMQGKVPTMVGIGGALPVMVGLQDRAPLWMQRFSLEWLFRLIQEPERLWKRYFFTNTIFIALLTREIFKTRILGIKS